MIKDILKIFWLVFIAVFIRPLWKWFEAIWNAQDWVNKR